MRIKLNDSLNELMIYKRKKLNLSQKDVAIQVGISHQTYQRIENGINKNCEKDVLKKICDVLEIKWSNISDSKTELKSYRIPSELLEKILMFQKKNSFSSETETIIFILNDYFLNENFVNIREEMEEFLEDIVVKTFIKEMKKMGRDIEKYKAVLEMIEAKEHLNTLAYINEYEENLYKKIHAERM